MSCNDKENANYSNEIELKFVTSLETQEGITRSVMISDTNVDLFWHCQCGLWICFVDTIVDLFWRAI